MDPDRLLHASFVFSCGLWLVWWLVWHMAAARVASGCLFLSKALVPPFPHPTAPQLPTTQQLPPLLPPNHPHFISTTPDITAVTVKASPNQAGQTISNKIRPLYLKLNFQCKSYASTTNYSWVIPSEFFKLTFLKTSAKMVGFQKSSHKYAPRHWWYVCVLCARLN